MLGPSRAPHRCQPPASDRHLHWEQDHIRKGIGLSYRNAAQISSVPKHAQTR